MSHAAAPPPWTRDITVDPEELASLAHRTLGIRDTLTPLGGGWDFDTWLCGGWVVRVPKRRRLAPALHAERALCAWLASRLPWQIPAYEAMESLPSEPDIPVGFYRQVPGRPAISVPLADADVRTIGARLGEGLRAMHAIAPSTVPADLPGERMRPLSLDESVARAVERLPSLARAGSPALARRVENVLRGPKPFPFEGAPRLVHADIHGEHLLLTDTKPARLSGVIDWGDARRGDPALDFACPTFWGGPALLRAALETYGPLAPGGEDMEALAERASFLALCLGFLDVDYYVRTDQRAYANAAVRSFDALTFPSRTRP